jgi:CRP-like cAMP-binding protein
VLAGSIRVVKAAPNGRELPLYRVTPGETCIISSACLLGHTPYNARGVTETDTTLLLVPNADFQALLGEAAFRDFIFQLFSERIADLMQLIEEVAFRKLDQRLAALLLGKGAACTPPTSSSPTSWAACARSSAGCSRASPSRAWWPSPGSRWTSSTRPACAASPAAEPRGGCVTKVTDASISEC